jgi:hypothetical protein
MIVAKVRRRFIAADLNKRVFVATRFIALKDGSEERGNTEKEQGEYRNEDERKRG